MDTLLGRRRSLRIFASVGGVVLGVLVAAAFFSWFGLGRVSEAAVEVTVEGRAPVIGAGARRALADEAQRAPAVGPAMLPTTTTVAPTSTTVAPTTTVVAGQDQAVEDQTASTQIEAGVARPPQQLPATNASGGPRRTGTSIAQAPSNTLPTVVVTTPAPTASAPAAPSDDQGESAVGAGESTPAVASTVPLPAATPSPSALPAPDTALGRFDFAAKRYRDVCDDLLEVEEFTLDQGVWANDSATLAVSLLGVQYADFTGDGAAEAVVSLRCEDLTGRYVQFEHYVYREAADGSPTLLHGRAFGAESVSIILDGEGYGASQGLWVRVRDYSAAPGNYLVSRWAWDDTSFIEVEPPSPSTLPVVAEGAATTQLATASN